MVRGIALSPVSRWTVACLISPMSTTPYSAAHGEPPLENNVPSPVAHQLFYKVSNGFVYSDSFWGCVDQSI